MAGSMALALTTVQRPVAETEMRWGVQYSRFFGFLHTVPDVTTSSVKIFHSRGTWLSSSSPTAILSLSTDPSFSGFVLTVSFNGKILEQHYVSKLHFSWPQLSCLSNAPGRASGVVFVSYKDETSVMQKFALRFSTNYEVGEFVTLLEDSFSYKQHVGDLMITHLSQSEVKDVLSEVTPTGASQILEMNSIATLHPPKAEQLQEDDQSHSIDMAANDTFEGYVPALPPRFTTLVTNCSEMVQGDVVAANTPSVPHEADLKSLIVKYLDDASFLDILSKAEEVIAEMGGDNMQIQEFV